METLETLIEKVDLNQALEHIEEKLSDYETKSSLVTNNNMFYEREAKNFRKIISFLKRKNEPDYNKKEYYFFVYLLTVSFTWKSRENERNRIVKLFRK